LSVLVIPFDRRRSAVFGTVRRPVVPVALWSARARAWVEVVMLVDTGADVTLLPHPYADILGVDLSRQCRPITSAGIGGTEAVQLLPRLAMRLGPWSRRIPVGFLRRDDVPPLLGRIRCLDTFAVRLADWRTRFDATRRG